MITGGNMNLLLSLGKVFVLFAVVSAKPVLQKDGPPPIDVHEDINDEVKDHTGLSYDRYLKEVVYALEEDPEFKKKLESANVSYIKSGEIAKHLDLVGHHIRTKLDEIKRREVQRLLELRRLQMRQMQGTEMLHYIAYHGGVDKMHIPNHLDIGNPHSFEMKDLEKLVKQTTRDIEELDKQRDLEFKQYEMEKEFERKKHLAELPEDERKKEMEKLEELKKKHEQHPRVNHPGSKDQFEEVWHEEDHIDKEQAFDPKSFFKLHDTTGDGVWDIQEVEALLNHELGKVYDDRNPSEEDDPYEREHERMRMRQHIMSEMDKNHDQLITKEEFLNYTGAKGENEEFKKDEGWKLQEEDDLFSDDEYQKFIQQYHAGEAQPGVVQHLGDPNVVNMHQASMGHPGGIDPNLQYQGQHPQGYQPPADHPAQFGQPLHPEQQQQLHHAYLQQQAQMAANLADNAARMNQQFAHTGQQMPGGQQPVPVQHLDPQHQQQLHQQQLHQQQLHQQQQHQVNQQEQQVNQQQQHNEQQAQQAQHQTGQQEQPQTGQQVHAQQPVEQQQQQQQQAQAQQPVEQQHQQQQQQAQQQGQPQGQPQGQQQPVQMNQANAQPPHA